LPIARKWFERLCRLMCGKAMPFRLGLINPFGLRPVARRSLVLNFNDQSERPSLSAHQLAKPQGIPLESR
jgi:hypothetical protein